MLMIGDLHTHTFISDGTSNHMRILELAKGVGVDCISITDHDYINCLDDIEPIAKQYGITLINGVELSSFDMIRKKRIHILCYLPKRIEYIKDICNSTTLNRREAGLEMACNVAKLYNAISVEDIQLKAANSKCIYKQHIMSVLMDAGYTNRIYGELFDELFNFSTGSCIVNCKQPDVYEVIEAVKNAGGICVMAHPFTYNSIDILNEFLDKKLLDGVEVWSSKSTLQQEEYLFNLTEKYGVIATGGSDFHGGFGAKVSPIGSKVTPESSINAIFELSKIRN